MRLGTLVYPTKNGLGYQTKSYCKHLPVIKKMVIDITHFNGMEKTNWYDEPHVHGYPSRQDIKLFLDGLDAVLLAETPLNYELYELARRYGVKTAVVYNYEFFDHFVKHFPLPDIFIAPSSWGYDHVNDFALHHGIQHHQLCHPVDRDEFVYTQRTTAKVFHIAGKPAAHDRNGTIQFLQAFPDGTVLIQTPNSLLKKQFPRARFVEAIAEPTDMYNYGDILVLPRRYGGNCLPMNEALSCGIPVVMPDITPNNDILPREWLVKAHKVGHFTPRVDVDLYDIDIDDLREKVANIQQNIQMHSEIANSIAQQRSWQVMKHKYIQALT